MTDATIEIATLAVLALGLVAARVATWRACRTPLGRVNHEMAQARERRRQQS